MSLHGDKKNLAQRGQKQLFHTQSRKKIHYEYCCRRVVPRKTYLVLLCEVPHSAEYLSDVMEHKQQGTLLCCPGSATKVLRPTTWYCC